MHQKHKLFFSFIIILAFFKLVRKESRGGLTVCFGLFVGYDNNKKNYNTGGLILYDCTKPVKLPEV